MSLIDELKEESRWREFQRHKTEKNQLSKKEESELEEFITERRYLSVLSHLNEFPLPEKRIISKMGTAKKRIVYCYPKDETWVLKLLTFLLYKYDNSISPACYSFRRSMTAKNAVLNIMAIPNLENKYVLKTDIHDYFNSMPENRIVEVLKDIITDDPKLLDFLTMLFTQEEGSGAMAGVPVSAFIANIYLRDLDDMFLKMGVPYFRYSDDILIFADTKEQLDNYQKTLTEHIKNIGLLINPDKTVITHPGESFDFLGFKFADGQVDLSDATIEKMEGKIRRKAHRLWRWRQRNKADYDRAAHAMIRSFDRKFYDITGENEFTWSRWFFPVLTKTDGLHEIDEYMVQYLRYLYSGRHYKGNYAITYDHLKRLGYTSLVNEYYNWKKMY